MDTIKFVVCSVAKQEGSRWFGQILLTSREHELIIHVTDDIYASSTEAENAAVLQLYKILTKLFEQLKKRDYNGHH